MWIGEFSWSPLDFHLHFWSHLTWFSLKRPLNGLFDFADRPKSWFLHAMTHCVVETEQLCWFWIQRCIQKSRYPRQITSGINAENLHRTSVEANGKLDNPALLPGLFVFTTCCLCSSLQIHLAGNFPLQVQGTGTSLTKVMEKKKMQNCVFMEKNVLIGCQTPSTWPDKRCAWSKMSDSQDTV